MSVIFVDREDWQRVVWSNYRLEIYVNRKDLSLCINENSEYVPRNHTLIGIEVNNDWYVSLHELEIWNIITMEVEDFIHHYSRLQVFA